MMFTTALIAFLLDKTIIMKYTPSIYGLEYPQDMNRFLDHKTHQIIDFFCNCRIEFIRATMWKCHDYWYVPWRKLTNFFMLLVYKGNMQVKISDNYHELGKGDFFLCPPGQEHTFGFAEHHKNAEYLVLHFRMSSLIYPVVDRLFMDSFFKLPSRKQYLFDQLKLLPALEDKDISVYNYADYLLKDIFFELAFSSKNKLYPLSSLDNRISKAVAFINENYLENISITNVADIAELSEAQFRKIFREQMHCSPLKYLTSLRLQKACLILLQTSEKVSEIAKQSGFGSSDYFCRIFKKNFNYTPNEYRNSIISQ